MDDILKGKRVLIVDDELDILETLEDLLDMCLIDTAPNFESARKFLDHTTYDVSSEERDFFALQVCLNPTFF